MADDGHRGHRGLGYAALAAAGSLWGTGFVFGKWALVELSVAHMVLLRFVFASAGLAVVLWRERHRSPIHLTRADLPLVLLAALIGVPVQYLVQFEGLSRTTVSHASLMVGVLPVLLAVAAVLFARERLDAIGWTGLLASTIGAGLVAFGANGATGAHGATLVGDLFVVASLCAGVVWVLSSQALMHRGNSPLMTSALVVIIGTVLLVCWVIATQGMPPVAHLSLRTWLSVAAMGLLATTVTTLLWNWGLARVPASRAGVFVNLEPVVGTTLGVALFHDSFGAMAVVGGALIVTAAIIVSRRASI
jgi:drug/metabolite transporter (DMT)-like permease